MSATKISGLLEELNQQDIFEAKPAGRNERRKFWKVTFPNVAEETVVEAPGKGRAIENALLVMHINKSMARGIAHTNRDRAKAELISAFTPADIPFLTKDTVEGTSVEPWLFDDVQRELKQRSHRTNKHDYMMAMIPVVHPLTLENSWSLVPAYMLMDYINKGYKAMGKAAAQRRAGSSDAPYWFGSED